MLRRGVKIFQNNKIKEREHSNKWDPSERFFKEPLLWGIRPNVVGGGGTILEPITQGNDSHSTKGPLGEVL